MTFAVTFVLLFARLSFALMFLPFMNTRDVPTQLKVAIVSFFCFILMINGTAKLGIDPTSGIQFFLGILLEILNGLMIGSVVLIITNAVYMAGQIVDLNIGYTFVSVLNPTGENEMPVTANFYYLLMMIMFLLLNLHHMIIETLYRYVGLRELGTLSFRPNAVQMYTKLMSDTIDIGVRMSLPVLITILICDLILGILSKAMPGLNVFIIGMPFKVLVGLFVILISFFIIAEQTEILFGMMKNYLIKILPL